MSRADSCALRGVTGCVCGRARPRQAGGESEGPLHASMAKGDSNHCRKGGARRARRKRTVLKRS